MSRLVRFDRYLCNLGYATRSTVMKFARKQNVTIKGKRVKSAGDMVNPDDIWINDKPIPYPENLSIVLHKPRGYVTSRKREVDSKIIYDLLPPEFFNRKPLLVAAGRLDKWASGLVVMSQDHQFVHRLAGPKVKAGALGKVYHVQLMNDLTGSEVGTFASGKLLLRSETKELKPAKIEVIDPEEKLVQMTLYEGRYHQIRRMLAAVKNKAVSIHRVQIGHWRVLTPQEIESVWKMELTPAEKKVGETQNQDSNQIDSSNSDVSSTESSQKVATARVALRKSVAEIRKTKKKMQKLKERREEAKFLKENKHMAEELKEELANEKKLKQQAEKKPTKTSDQKPQAKVFKPKTRRNSGPRK